MIRLRKAGCKQESDRPCYSTICLPLHGSPCSGSDAGSNDADSRGHEAREWAGTMLAGRRPSFIAFLTCVIHHHHHHQHHCNDHHLASTSATLVGVTLVGVTLVRTSTPTPTTITWHAGTPSASANPSAQPACKAHCNWPGMV